MDQTQSLHAPELERPTRDPGSFRDPSGCVCHFGGEVFRAVDQPCAGLMTELHETGLLRKLQERADLIPTRIVDRGEPVCEALRRFAPEAGGFLHHEKVPFFNYPYEWSPSMLADAALCTLEMQILLVESGYSLKDATAYNVPFANGRPVFIDVPSIEKVRRQDVWTALHQFYRMFLFPLLLSRYRRCTVKEYFLGNLDGAELDDVYHRFGVFFAMRPSLLMDVWLPVQLQWLIRDGGKKLREKVERKETDAKALLMNLARLKRKIRGLARRPHGKSHWLDYTKDNTYADEEERKKAAFVEDFLDRHRVRRVLDVGCNTGRFSQIAAGRGASVVAIDTDEACIDALYHQVRERRLDILPLVVDIANPSPGVGFRNGERASFMDRASGDCVFALALVHHLLVTARIPLDSIRDLLADLTSDWLIIEYVDPKDAMFQSLLGAREDLYGELSLQSFERAFESRFEIIERKTITNHRTLFAMKKR